MPATRKLSLAKMVCMVFACCVTTTISLPAQTFNTLLNFNDANGGWPVSSLIQGADGNFYGTTDTGGAIGWGTAFVMSPTGSLTTIYNFCNPSNCSDGSYPYGGLVRGSDGTLYGTTLAGGTGFGTVFKLTQGASGWTLTTLHNFNGSDGNYPAATLLQGSDGNFYGTTVNGGPNNAGTVFKITPSGTLTTLYAFNGTDGRGPYAALAQGPDGNLYGTTCCAGSPDNPRGSVFKITPNGTLTNLYTFCSPSNCSDGGVPYASLTLVNGNFYGTTSIGGTGPLANCGVTSQPGWGTVFQITPAGTLTTLHTFNGTEGGVPYAGLLLASDGNFYGTTACGGTNNDGVVFEMTLGGTVTTLHNFNGSDGDLPYAGLLQAGNGTFYGSTVAGGTGWGCGWLGHEYCGTLFTMSGPSANALQFVPLSQPCRAVDTRPGQGGGGPIQSGTFQSFNISGAGHCATLPSAAVYSLNVTVVPAQRYLGYLTVWPAGQSRQWFPP